jgi:RNA polymerase sigma-70 factor (ECF subfamily)
MSASADTPERSADRHAALVSAIAAGDARAEADFVRLFQPGIRALVRRHARPADPIVEDLVQDVIHQLIRRLRASALHDPLALPGYVRSTVVLTVQAEYRRRGRRGENAAAVSVDSLQGSDDPIAAAQREQMNSSVRTLLAELPTERDREILRRFYLQENDRDTVCAALGIDPDHFHRVLHRARQRLKALLIDAGIGDAP